MKTNQKSLAGTLLLALSTSVLLSACGGSSPEPEAAQPPTATAQVPDSSASPSTASGSQAATPPPSTLTPVTAAVAAAVERTGMCSFDKIDGVKVVPNAVAQFKNPASAQVEGWVADQASMSHPGDARLRLASEDHSHTWEIGLGTPVSRPDVANYYKTKALTDSGFSLTTDLSSLPPGVYRVTAAHMANGHMLMCGGPRVRLGG